MIEEDAQQRVARYAAEAERDGRIAARARAVPDDGGWFAAPTLAADLPADSPVLDRGDLRRRCSPSSASATSTRRATASTPRRSPSPAACSPATPTPSTASSSARPVGNLYVNRAITGAMVARQPFGGNRLSGTGTKAGGPGYLLQFVEPRVVTENTMRHGLVV